MSIDSTDAIKGKDIQREFRKLCPDCSKPIAVKIPLKKLLIHNIFVCGCCGSKFLLRLKLKHYVFYYSFLIIGSLIIYVPLRIANCSSNFILVIGLLLVLLTFIPAYKYHGAFEKVD